jgi:hypothetical protein
LVCDVAAVAKGTGAENAKRSADLPLGHKGYKENTERLTMKAPRQSETRI